MFVPSRPQLSTITVRALLAVFVASLAGLSCLNAQPSYINVTIPSGANGATYTLGGGTLGTATLPPLSSISAGKQNNWTITIECRHSSACYVRSADSGVNVNGSAQYTMAANTAITLRLRGGEFVTSGADPSFDGSKWTYSPAYPVNVVGTLSVTSAVRVNGFSTAVSPVARWPLAEELMGDGTAASWWKNLLDITYDLTISPWASTGTAVTGTQSAGFTFTGAAYSAVGQTITIPTIGKVRTANAWFKAGTAAKSSLCLFYAGGGTPAADCAVITWSGPTAAAGAGARITFTSMGDGWYRLAMTLASNSGNTTAQLTLGLDASGGTVLIDYPQMELGNTVTTYQESRITLNRPINNTLSSALTPKLIAGYRDKYPRFLNARYPAWSFRSQYMLGNALTTTLAQPFTLSLLARCEGSSGTIAAFTDRTSATAAHGIEYSASGSVRIYTQSGGSKTTSSAITVPLNDWVYLSLVSDGTTLTLFRVDTGDSVTLAAAPSGGSGYVSLGARGNSSTIDLADAVTITGNVLFYNVAASREDSWREYQAALSLAKAQGLANDYFIVFAGDSFSEEQTGASLKYTDITSQVLAVGHRSVALSGRTCLGMDSVRSRDADLYLHAGRQKTILTYWCGPNDLLLSGGDTATLLTEMATFAVNARAAGWGTIALLDMLPGSDSGYTGQRNTVNAALAGAHTFVDALVAVSGDGVIGIDAAGASTTYYYDGLHPSEFTHQIIARYLISTAKVLLGIPNL